MSDNSVKILKYLQSIGDEDVTAADVADALGLSVKVVNGAFTMSIAMATQVKKNPNVVPLGFRQVATVEFTDGSTGEVTFLKLTDAGKNYQV